MGGLLIRKSPLPETATRSVGSAIPFLLRNPITVRNRGALTTRNITVPGLRGGFFLHNGPFRGVRHNTFTFTGNRGVAAFRHGEHLLLYCCVIAAPTCFLSETEPENTTNTVNGSN
jgi:hypothetical protein